MNTEKWPDLVNISYLGNCSSYEKVIKIKIVDLVKIIWVYEVTNYKKIN